jgi:hypothetical protein
MGHTLNRTTIPRQAGNAEGDENQKMSPKHSENQAGQTPPAAWATPQRKETQINAI